MIPSRSQILRGHWTGWNRELIAPLGSWNLLVVMMYMCDPNTQADTGGSQLEARIHSMVLSFKREVRARYPFVITASSACLSLACSVLFWDTPFPLGSLCDMPHICALKQQATSCVDLIFI